MQKIPKWVNESKAADILDLSAKTLQNDRWLGRGIPYYKVGRSVRYLLDDVINYMESKKVRTKIG